MKYLWVLLLSFVVLLSNCEKRKVNEEFAYRIDISDTTLSKLIVSYAKFITMDSLNGMINVVILSPYEGKDIVYITYRDVDLGLANEFPNYYSKVGGYIVLLTYNSVNTYIDKNIIAAELTRFVAHNGVNLKSNIGDFINHPPIWKFSIYKDGKFENENIIGSDSLFVLDFIPSGNRIILDRNSNEYVIISDKRK